MMILLLAAVAAQLADLLTYDPLAEGNPLVVWLGTGAVALKLLLIVILIVMALRIKRPAMAHMLRVAVAVGCIGAASNILT